MRVAIVGSGGVGKSVISATLARVLARRGRTVLAVDLDPNPGMAFSLGLPPETAGLADEVIAPRAGGLYGWGLAEGIDVATAAERYATKGPDGVRFLASAKIDRGNHDVSRHLGAVRQIAEAAPASWDVVGDLEAGTTTPYEGYASFADQLVAVVSPSWRSGLAARRLCALFPDRRLIVVGSQYRGESAHPGLPLDVYVPFDPDLRAAEQQGIPPIDACPGSPVIEALSQLADLLVLEEVPV